MRNLWATKGMYKTTVSQSVFCFFNMESSRSLNAILQTLNLSPLFCRTSQTTPANSAVQELSHVQRQVKLEVGGREVFNLNEVN